MNEPKKFFSVEVAAPSFEGREQLAVLQRAVDKALDRKRRLGQYAVIWEEGKPVLREEQASGQNRRLRLIDHLRRK